MSIRLLAACCLVSIVSAQGLPADDPFRQLEELWPTPNAERNAAGAPGHGYWQQRADHEVDVEIDDVNQRLIGSQWITYHNHSPDRLDYLWLQLDNNLMHKGSDANLSETAPDMERFGFRDLKRLLAYERFDGSVKITAVNGSNGQPLPYTVVKTMMRIDLAEPLEPGSSVRFQVGWNYQINRADEIRARTAAEYFPRDDNWIYELAHWFPRMCAYTDVNGWQNLQFLGRGEFTLEFGDYVVRITVPADHVVAATGVLQNPTEVLEPKWRQRLEEARTSESPVLVITPEEAKANESSRSKEKKTWVFRAENVRDFAFATSRKFAWDAWVKKIEDRDVYAMSYFPVEGEPLWSRYSTQAVVHTLEVYSKHCFPYPYPVAISVNGPVGGMEYPMICFNGPRPETDGTYTQRTKYGLIGVIIHEVGHFWFPMIVNSDERQWTWMDEGLNTFVQFLAEKEWEENYPSRRGDPEGIIPYMTSEGQRPIMTQSDAVLQFGANAYHKPAVALNILRETIMGRELFDHAFRTFSKRWRFKRPQPADFFRTMEDASSIDLDWFWRGWFYSTDHVDIAIKDMRRFALDPLDPDVTKAEDKARRDAQEPTKTKERNAGITRRTDRFPYLLDFYNTYDPLDVTPGDRRAAARARAALTEDERKLLGTRRHFQVVDLVNAGGVPMPVILRITYDDGSKDLMRIPAEIWRRNTREVSKLLMTEKKVLALELDPQRETADADRTNNHWPRKREPSRFELFKRRQNPNPMREAREEAQRQAGGAGAGSGGNR